MFSTCGRMMEALNRLCDQAALASCPRLTTRPMAALTTQLGILLSRRMNMKIWIDERCHREYMDVFSRNLLSKEKLLSMRSSKTSEWARSATEHSTAFRDSSLKVEYQRGLPC